MTLYQYTVLILIHANALLNAYCFFSENSYINYYMRVSVCKKTHLLLRPISSHSYN